MPPKSSQPVGQTAKDFLKRAFLGCSANVQNVTQLVINERNNCASRTTNHTTVVDSDEHYLQDEGYYPADTRKYSNHSHSTANTSATSHDLNVGFSNRNNNDNNNRDSHNFDFTNEDYHADVVSVSSAGENIQEQEMFRQRARANMARRHGHAMNHRQSSFQSRNNNKPLLNRNDTIVSSEFTDLWNRADHQKVNSTTVHIINQQPALEYEDMPIYEQRAMLDEELQRQNMMHTQKYHNSASYHSNNRGRSDLTMSSISDVSNPFRGNKDGRGSTLGSKQGPSVVGNGDQEDLLFEEYGEI